MDFKVKCVAHTSNERNFTIGKVYEVRNGVLTDDDGYEYNSWSLSLNGNGDFESLKKWFAKYQTFELVEDKKVFTKSDLKNGDVIKKRNGNVEILVLPLGTLVTNDGNYNLLDDINDDLTSANGDCYDIVGVRRPIEVKDCRFLAFEYDYGEVVYERKEETKPLYNGKVVCIANPGNKNVHTVGKIYQFEDGMMTADNGKKYPKSTPIHSFKEWEDWTASTFIEIKE